MRTPAAVAASTGATPASDRAPLAAAGLAGLLAVLAARCEFGLAGANLPWLAALLVFLALLPALAWSLRRSELRAVPFLPAVGCLYALYYGLPFFLSVDVAGSNLVGTTASASRALVLAIAGWVALLVGWRACAPCVARLRPLRLELDLDRTRRALPVLFGVGLAAMVAERTLALPAGLVQPVRFLGQLFQVALGILAVLSFRGALGGRARAVLWLLLIPAYLFLQVGVGSVAQLVYASMFLFFLAWGGGRRVPLVALAVMALGVLLLRGHVHAFRAQVWDRYGSEAEAGLWERSVLFVEIVIEEVREERGGALERATREVSDRVAHSRTFAHVVELTPERVPYWDGETYAALPSTLVPRALWPQKPRKEVGQAFGHRYGIIAPADRTTSVNLPQTVELYANFGPLGVLLGMLALGVLWRVLERLWNTPGSGDGTLLLGALVFSRLILIESDFALVYGAVIQTAILLVLVLRAIGPRRVPAGPLPAIAGGPR